MQELKTFNVRIEKELWAFLKKQSVDREIPMTELVQICLRKYKKKWEKKLLTSEKSNA